MEFENPTSQPLLKHFLSSNMGNPPQVPSGSSFREVLTTQIVVAGRADALMANCETNVEWLPSSCFGSAGGLPGFPY